MSLQTRYSQEDDIVLIATSERGEGSCDVEGHYWTNVILPFGGGYKPVALEIMFVSELMPLSMNKGYSAETDTLVIGQGERAALVEENDDLTAYWCPEEDADDLSLVAVSLRNASKHMAPVIKEMQPG